MSSLQVVHASLIAAFATAVIGCSSAAEAPTCTDEFVATQAAFQNFHNWQSYVLDSNPVAGASPHTTGPRTEYINNVPGHGETEFAVGTVIVKEFTAVPLAQRQVFGMVKRGCGFNSDGANGWEWFDIQNNADGSETVIWRGFEPPLGQTYSGDPTACNTCHGTAKSNDFVQSQALQLSNF